MRIIKPIVENRLYAYALVVAFIVVFTGYFYLRAALYANERDVLAPPKVVNVQIVKLQDSYEIEDAYTGRIEPNRKTFVSFERPGLVLKVNVEEGQEIKEGDVIASLDKSSLLTRKDQLMAQKKQLDANLELAELTLSRQESLYKKKFGSQRSFDQARVNRDVVQAQVSEVMAALNSLEIDLEKSEVKAPFTGVVSVRSVDEGAVVGAGTPLIELLESDPVYARVGLPPAVADDIQVGQSFDIRLDGESRKVVLRALRSDLEESTRTVSALFELEGMKDATFGQIIKLSLKRTVKGRGAWLPVTSLVEGQKGLWNVFVAQPSEDGQYQIVRESVEIVHSTETDVYVRGTLKDGQKVISDGVHKVIPGATVTLAKG